jgi:alpha-1,2-mannosyltransferase
MESLGTMVLAYKALETRMPHVFIDTTGCAFTYFVASILGGCQVGAYVHYPTISTDMLRLVWARRPTYNNDSQVAKSLLMTYIKLVYYLLFAVSYGMVGSLANLVMVNSTWTFGHISSIWRGVSRINIVFPPCDVTSLMDLSLEGRQDVVISIGQFRPEKEHSLQIRSLAILRKKYPRWKSVRLVLVGSCRGEADEGRVKMLRDLVQALDLVESVDFVMNQPYSVVKEWFGKSSVGIHTMWNEHFGIGVVEMMAAGLLVIAHNSGGPKADIITPLNGNKTGYLAATAEEYADAMNDAFSLEKARATEIRRNARKSASRFSDEVFNDAFKKAIVESRILMK